MQNWPNYGYRISYVASVPPVTPAATNLWSDPATWGGSVPIATDVVTIAAGHTVYLDTTSAVAASLDIQGSLIAVQTSSVGLTTGDINIGGAGSLIIGTESTPYPSAYTATITLNGAEVGRTTRTVTVSGTSQNLGFTNNGVGRSMQVQPGGVLSLIGVAPAVKRTKINAQVAAGTNTFTLMENTGWKAGDNIVMGTTDFYGVSVPEKLTLANNASGTTIQSTTTIAAPRWGVLQYVTDTGMSLTAGTLTNAPVGVPTIVDERAMVINLTRNIIVQGANDTAWTSNKFGAHCMFMSGGATSGTAVFPSIKLDGVRFNRMGQAGAIGRYPIHWHMMSYNMTSGTNVPSPDGVFIGAVSGHYAKNCSFDSTGQRMIVIHGTHGVTLDTNVGFDITGHAIFLEDGAEQDNVITNNVVMKIRSPTTTNKLLLHDTPASDSSPGSLGTNGTIGSAGIWNTNPKNTFTGNWVNDSEGAGFWSSFSRKCFGLATNVALTPISIPLTLIGDTTSMGNKGTGQLTNDIVLDDFGNSAQDSYTAPFIDNPLFGLKLFKNGGGGYSNRISQAKYQNFVCADNQGMDVFGQSQFNNSLNVQTLVVSESLNNATSRAVSSYRSAFATYHEQLNFQDIIAVGYKYHSGYASSAYDIYTGGGLFRLWDLYIQGIISFSQNKNFKLIDCEIPFRTLPPFKDGIAEPAVDSLLPRRHWQIAGAIQDKNGIFGLPPGTFWVLDDPFFTHTATGLADVSPGNSANGKTTPDRYYGIGGFETQLSIPNGYMHSVYTSRENTAGVEVGNWNILDGNTSWALGNMRSAAVHKGGRYVLTFPQDTPGNYSVFDVLLQTDPNDIFLIGVQFDCSLNPIVHQASIGFGHLPDGRIDMTQTATPISQGVARNLTQVGTMAQVVADTTGTIFFKDTVRNLVWLQVKTNILTANQFARNGFFYQDLLSKEYQRVVTAITV